MTMAFTDQLRMLQHGKFAAECTDKLADVIRSVAETGKPGQLTVTLQFKKNGGVVLVLPKVTDKAPQEGYEPEAFWTTKDGSLSRQNPSQESLKFEEVQQPARTIAG